MGSQRHYCGGARPAGGLAAPTPCRRLGRWAVAAQAVDGGLGGRLDHRFGLGGQGTLVGHLGRLELAQAHHVPHVLARAPRTGRRPGRACGACCRCGLLIRCEVNPWWALSLPVLRDLEPLGFTALLGLNLYAIGRVLSLMRKPRLPLDSPVKGRAPKQTGPGASRRESGASSYEQACPSPRFATSQCGFTASGTESSGSPNDSGRADCRGGAVANVSAVTRSAARAGRLRHGGRRAGHGRGSVPLRYRRGSDRPWGPGRSAGGAGCSGDCCRPPAAAQSAAGHRGSCGRAGGPSSSAGPPSSRPARSC